MLRQEDLQIVLEVLPDPGPALEAVEQIGRALDEVFEGERDVRVPTPVPVPVTGARPPLPPPSPPAPGVPRPVPEAVEPATPAAPPPPPTSAVTAAPTKAESPGAAVPSLPPVVVVPPPPPAVVPPPAVQPQPQPQPLPVPSGPPPVSLPVQTPPPVPPSPPPQGSAPQQPPPALPPESFGPVHLLWPEGPPPALRWPEGGAPTLPAAAAPAPAGKDRPVHVHVDKEAPVVLLKREQAADDERLNAPPPTDLLGALRSSLGDRLGELAGKFAGPAGQEVTRGLVSEGKLPDLSGLLSSLGGKGGAAGGNLVGAVTSAAGPYAALIAAAPQLAESVGKLSAAPVAAAGKGLEAVGSGLRELQGELGPVGLALGVVEGVFSGVAESVKNIPVVGEMLAPLAEALAGLVKPVRDIVGSLMSMAGKASPAHARQWQLMLDDVQAVVGRGFLPFFTMMLEFGRDFGRLAATVLPNASEMSAAIAPLSAAWQELRGAFAATLAEFGPSARLALIGTVNLLSRGVAEVTRSFTGLLHVVNSVTGPVNQLTNQLVRLGLIRGVEGSEGAAARPAMLGDIASYQAAIYEGAYSMAISGPGDPAQQAANTLGDIYTLLERFLPVLQVQGYTPAGWLQAGGQAAAGAVARQFEWEDPFGVLRALRGW